MPQYVLDGHAPQVPEDGDYWIAPSADVIGKVKLESGASVWFGAVLRGAVVLAHPARQNPQTAAASFIRVIKKLLMAKSLLQFGLRATLPA